MKIFAGDFFSRFSIYMYRMIFWHKDVTLHLVTKIKFSAFLEEVCICLIVARHSQGIYR